MESPSLPEKALTVYNGGNIRIPENHKLYRKSRMKIQMEIEMYYSDGPLLYPDSETTSTNDEDEKEEGIDENFNVLEKVTPPLSSKITKIINEGEVNESIPNSNINKNNVQNREIVDTSKPNDVPKIESSKILQPLKIKLLKRKIMARKCHCQGCINDNDASSGDESNFRANASSKPKNLKMRAKKQRPSSSTTSMALALVSSSNGHFSEKEEEAQDSALKNEKITKTTDIEADSKVSLKNEGRELMEKVQAYKCCINRRHFLI